MAINDNAPYSGEVEYGLVNADEPGAVVNGGSLNIDPQVSVTDGIGMQRVSHRSYYTGVVTYDVTHPVISPLSAMIRTSASNSVTGITCIAGNQDGKWTLTGCQPSGFTARCAIGEPLTANLGYWGIPAQSATGAAQGSATGPVAAGATGFGVAVDGADYFVQSWEVGLNTNPYWFAAQNHTTSSAAPTSVKLGRQEVTLRLGCAKQFPDATALFTGDAHDSDIDVTIRAVNASDVSIILFTLSDLCTPVEAGTYQVGGMKVWNYNFRAAAQLGALTVATGA